MEQPTVKQGWLYALTCGIYRGAAEASARTYPYTKLGYTTTPVDLEEQVIKQLQYRYMTALLDPVILKVIPVKHPRLAESALFEALRDVRLSHNREVFCADFDDTILPAMQQTAEMFENYDPVEEVSTETPKHTSKTVRRLHNILQHIARSHTFGFEEASRRVAEASPQELQKYSRSIAGIWDALDPQSCAAFFTEAKHDMRRQMIARLCQKLGLRNTVDMSVRVSRSVIDNDIPGFAALLKDVRTAFSLRPSQAKKGDASQSAFKKILSDINVVLRAWSDVALKDVNGRKTSRKGSEFVYCEELHIVPGDFLKLFVS